MEISYQRTPTFKFVGIFFILVGLAYFVMWILSHFVFFYLVPIALLNLLIGGLHYFVHHQFYIICNSDQLVIRSNLLFITRIKRADILRFEKDKSQFTLYYGRHKKKNIYFKYMSPEDQSQFEDYLLGENTDAN